MLRIKITSVLSTLPCTMSSGENYSFGTAVLVYILSKYLVLEPCENKKLFIDSFTRQKKTLK